MSQQRNHHHQMKLPRLTNKQNTIHIPNDINHFTRSIIPKAAQMHDSLFYFFFSAIVVIASANASAQ